jgi:hypothetical protein
MSNHRSMGGLFPKKSNIVPKNKTVQVNTKRERSDEDDRDNEGSSKKSKTGAMEQKSEAQKVEAQELVANAGTLFAIRRDKNKDFCQLMDQAGDSTNIFSG